MFLCVSPNPAIDKRITLPALAPGEIHRARAAQAFPGGKSAHVAMVLKALGAEPHWIGLCGGASGDEVLDGLDSLGIATHFTPTSAETRTNVEIIEDSSRVTEIREPGETVSPEEVAAFERDCAKLFQQGREHAVAIFSGSLPPGAPSDLFARLISAARAVGCKTCIDTSGEPLRLALSAHPDFVKPNRDEAAALLSRSIDSKDAAEKALREIIRLGACRAALSLGSAGLLYSPGANAQALFAPALSLTPRSTVGCGDAALAGFAFALASSASAEETLRLAAACAAANCVADSPGAVRSESIHSFKPQIRIESLLAAP